MELLNELGNDLALAFLVEKKHRAKIDSKSALALIEKVKKVLQPVSNEKTFPVRDFGADKCAATSSY